MATISFTASAFPGPAAAGSVYGVACFDAARPVPVRTSPAPKRRARENSGFRQRPTLPGGLPPSTIGAGGLNGRVRNGNGCGPSAIATGILRTGKNFLGSVQHQAALLV